MTNLRFKFQMDNNGYITKCKMNTVKLRTVDRSTIQF